MTIQDLEKLYKLDKNGKIVKKGEESTKGAEPTKRQKINFNDLKVQEIEGDEVYEAEKDKLRERKAQKKE